MYKRFAGFFILFTLFVSMSSNAEERPNILFILADDMGVDALNAFDVGTVFPNTPHIDELCESGVTFTNTWACPACTPTRASLLTGKYGVNSGVNTVPEVLDTGQKSIFKELDELTMNAYASCVVGKWHVSNPSDIDHPYALSVDDFMGVMDFGVEDYFNWAKVENHESTTCTEYVTSYLTDYAAKWINQQTKPWFMWLAHIAPHTPFHVPPEKLYTSDNVSTNLQKYIAMIESMDYEIGRLLDSIPSDILENTIVIFLGDNGTPGNVLQGFPDKKGKNTVYQGGINVPLIISGKGVSRINEKEDAMINVSDFYATIAQIAEPDALPSNQINDSYSFKHLLTSPNGEKRSYNYMELGANHTIPTDVYTMRDSKYKIIYDIDGRREFFDLSVDPFETNNLLLNNLSPEQLNAKLGLEQQMYAINSKSFEDEIPYDTTIIFSNTYTIVGTGQANSYNNSEVISLPTPGDSFYGQNTNHPGNTPSYTDNGDGTITDNVSGLMWEKSPDRNGDELINYYDKMTYEAALANASLCTTGGYSDWRLPTIKEQYSLIMYYGAEPSPIATSQGNAVPYINTNYFDFAYGDMDASLHGATSDERIIDAQYATSTLYVSTTMNGNSTMFGVNFADGRIKGYPSNDRKKYCVLYVRDNSDYGKNSFMNNEDGTITDQATGLMWMQNDNGSAISWEDALSYAESSSYAGYSDWRLPDIKELQSILDYSRSPETTNSAAIDAVFNCTQITNEAGNADYAWYWSNTTFCSQTPTKGNNACYMSFGRAMGYMSNLGGWIDVHGAGAQRSDPKTGNPADWPTGFGPQGDAIRINNYVRLVRNAEPITGINKIENNYQLRIYPNPAKNFIAIENDRQIKNISIFTMQGLMVTNNRIQASSIQVNTSHLSNGMYIISITDDMGQRHSEKIIIN
ncbi:MAG: sulfatase-like hydrolase/transferase [Bacteroidales bacterium]|nr:sulfatase-like hydrolase/transferase [Bacteroidales bacterium]MCF8405371.1 sulfatase-like hydrolase/transferase [Bacteroidales bacterium]